MNPRNEIFAPSEIERIDLFLSRLSEISFASGIVLQTRDQGFWVIPTDRLKQLGSITYRYVDSRWDLTINWGVTTVLPPSEVEERLGVFLQALAVLSSDTGIVLDTDKVLLTHLEPSVRECLSKVIYQHQDSDLIYQLINEYPRFVDPDLVSAQETIYGNKQLEFASSEEALKAYSSLHQETGIFYVLYHLNSTTFCLITPEQAEILYWHGRGNKLCQVLSADTSILRPYVPRNKPY